MGWQVPIPPVAYTPEIATDTTARTITTTTFGQVSGDFSIQANDPDVGSVYILTFWGTSNFSSPVAGELRPSIFGVNLTTLQFGGGASGFIVTVYLIVTAVGVSGSVNGVINLAGASGFVAAPGFAIIPATTVNTTAASVFGVQGAFTALTGGPTMTVDATIYERDGPGATAQ